jgi:hypothetical protein
MRSSAAERSSTRLSSHAICWMYSYSLQIKWDSKKKKNLYLPTLNLEILSHDFHLRKTVQTLYCQYTTKSSFKLTSSIILHTRSPLYSPLHWVPTQIICADDLQPHRALNLSTKKTETSRQVFMKFDIWELHEELSNNVNVNLDNFMNVNENLYTFLCVSSTA